MDALASSRLSFPRTYHMVAAMNRAAPAGSAATPQPMAAAAGRSRPANTAWNASAGSGGLIRSPWASSQPSSCRRRSWSDRSKDRHTRLSSLSSLGGTRRLRKNTGILVSTSCRRSGSSADPFACRRNRPRKASSRMRSRRNWCNQESVRSTTHRYAPSPLPWGVPHLANTGVIPRARRRSRGAD